RGELARQGILLRSGRTRRRPRGRSSSPGARIVGMTSIDARPAEASDRAVPGAWEGDLVIGKAGRSAMATLVALPAGRRDAATTCDALIAAVSGMPSQLVKTLTWDQGSEMAGHAAFSLATAVVTFPRFLGGSVTGIRRSLGLLGMPIFLVVPAASTVRRPAGGVKRGLLDTVEDRGRLGGRGDGQICAGVEPGLVLVRAAPAQCPLDAPRV